MRNIENPLIEVILPKIDFIIFFQTNKNMNTGVFTNTDKTIQETIETYFFQMGNNESFKNKNNIQFKFGEKILDANSKEKVGQFLIFIENPLIHVILPKEEILIKFKITKELEENLKFEDDKTMSDLFKSFLHKFGSSDISKNANKFKFKFSGKIFDYYCQDKLDQTFGYIKNPEIDVIFPKEEIIIIFCHIKGNRTILFFDKGKSITDLIKDFLNIYKRPDLFINKKNVHFLYNATPIDFNSQERFGIYLSKLEGIPIITIIDTKGEINFNQN